MAKLTSTAPGSIPGFRFRIEALGLNIGQASQIENFSSNTGVVTYRGGADSNTFRKQKGLTTYDDLTISRIYTNNASIWAQLGLVFEPTAGLLGLTSPIYKTDLIISMFDISGNEVVQFFFKNAWIRGYEISDLDSNTSQYAIERVIFAHEGFTKIGIDI